MKKLLFLVAFLIGAAAALQAEVLDPAQAAQRAIASLNKSKHGARALGQTPRAERLKLVHTALTQGREPAVYVYNQDGGGFLLAPASDNVAPVLGYSTSGSFSPQNCPDGLAYLLEEYAKAIEGRSVAPAQSQKAPRLRVEPLSLPSAVDPLLGEIEWNQMYPYNALTPNYTYEDNAYHAPTGCVATAMAQIMYYHQWPLNGRGQHSYSYDFTNYDKSTEQRTASSDFSQHTYAWGKMFPSYGQRQLHSTEVKAIAQLMYDVGVAFDMGYGAQGSGAYSERIPQAMKDYFDYAEGICRYMRDNYTAAEWHSLLRSELAAKRPVYLSGGNISGAHAFVCDGYNADGLYHINWGWGGVSNGYFNINSLNPNEQGVGGSSSGYNVQLDAITGIQPSTKGELTPDIHLMYFTNQNYPSAIYVTSSDLGEGFYSMVFQLANPNMDYDFLGDIEVFVEDNNGATLYTDESSLTEDVVLGASRAVLLSYDVPASIINNNVGNLRAGVRYRQAGSSEWRTVRNASFQSYAELYSEDGALYFGIRYSPRLEGLSLAPVSTDPVMENEEATFRLSFKAKREFCGYAMILYITETTELTQLWYGAVAMDENEETTLEFPATFPTADTYALYVSTNDGLMTTHTNDYLTCEVQVYSSGNEPPTAITPLTSAHTQLPAYDLTGRRIRTPQSGITLRSGQKIIR